MAFMRKLLAWLGAAASIFVISAYAHAGTPTALKPYVTLILDTSGSMIDTTQGNPTGFGPPSCGAHCSVTLGTLCNQAADCPTSETCVPQIDNKLNHARCAINNIANSYADIVFALGRFRNVTSGTTTLNTFASGCCDHGPDAGACVTPPPVAITSISRNAAGLATVTLAAPDDETVGENVTIAGNSHGSLNGTFAVITVIDSTHFTYQAGGGATTGTGGTVTQPGPSITCSAADSMFELLTPLVDGANETAATWTNFTGNTCTSVGTDPEIWNADSNTPLGGAIAGSQRYYQGLQATDGTAILSSGGGFDPILSDPTNSVFLSPTGDTTCNPNPDTCKTTGKCSITTGTSCTKDANCPGGETCSNLCCASQCRPYIVVMLTDGMENCGGSAPTAATALFGTEIHAITLTSLTATANVVTAVTATPHPFVVGNSVVINGANTTTFDGTFTITTVADNTHFTYAQTITGTTAGLAGAPFYAALNDPVTITSITRNGSNVVTVTTAGHQLQATQSVVIAGVTDASFNGTFTVLSSPAPTGTQFSYTQAHPLRGAATSSGGTASHAAMLYRYEVQTKAIGFGVTPPSTSSCTTVGQAGCQIEDIAHAGGAPDVPNVLEGYYASDQTGIELAVADIISKSLRVETCNGLDDDCDTRIDEDFPTKGQACDNGEKGVCLVTGTLVCRADGTGVQCNAGLATCAGQPDGQACTVVNSAGATVNGTCTSQVCNPTPGVEICNGLDDDCDGLVDEGLVGCTCTPQAETCDHTDQDWDGHPDQSCRCSNNNTQICKVNGDCGGANTCVCTDLVRNCGTGTCVGTQTCGDTNGDGKFDTANGIYGACSAPPVCVPGHCSVTTATTCTQDSQCPVGQTCNTTDADCGICDGKDNDCDGVCDGFNEACSLIGNGNPANNLGDPSHHPIPQNICHPGAKNCPEFCGATNSFGTCTGEEPGCNPGQDGSIHCDVCDGLDNDCDNKIDEDFVPTTCSSNCGVGLTQCINGVVSCNAVAGTTDATCDGVDDDCDGHVDEDWTCDPSPGCQQPGPGVLHPCCDCGAGLVCDGVNKCINGTVECTGGAINVEVCNCLDDDCDGKIDENVTCGAGAQCVGCQCAFQCNPGEFPCPLGKKCLAEGSSGNFCINDPCFGVTCPAVNGNAQACFDNGDNTSKCVDICSLTCNANNLCPNDMSCVSGSCVCQTPLACDPANGECLPNDCTTYPDRCTANQNCINGACVTNLCQGVTCPDAQYCVAGQCYNSCAGVDCPTGQRCRLGTCETDPCGHACPFGQACNDSTGQCIDDPCPFRDCPQGQWCDPNDGQCEDDPCVGTKCPVDGQICKGGTCYDPSEFEPDAGSAQHVTVGGGGCNTGGDSGGGVIVLGAVAMLISRRRRGGRS